MDSLAKKNYRSELKRIDWDFTGENGSDGFAAYHWYPARYVPRLSGILINYFSEPGGIILDPFCGSGTTLVEAFKFGRLAIGVDLNPIAVLMTKAKLVPFDEKSYASYVDIIIREARELLLNTQYSLLHVPDVAFPIPNYEENKSWYHPDTLRELAAIWNAVRNHTKSKYYDVGSATFSAILKYSCSQDKHWGWVCDNVKPRRMVYRDALMKFSEKLAEYGSFAEKLQDDAAELQEMEVSISESKVYGGDCAEVLAKFPEQMFDLVVTSPPYYNMTDYISSQRLSYLWFDFNTDMLRVKEIGARYKRYRKNPLYEYLHRMKDSFLAITRVLKSGSMCCVVIGESPRHKPFLYEFEKICEEMGLRLIEALSRRISRHRSLSPILHQEKIFILRKV